MVTRKLPEPLTTAQALERVQRMTRSYQVFALTPMAVLEGCRGSAQHQLAIWDALIWAVAKLNEVPYVLTEDIEHDRSLEGVRFLDPFSPRFDLDALVPA